MLLVKNGAELIGALIFGSLGVVLTLEEIGKPFVLSTVASMADFIVLVFFPLAPILCFTVTGGLLYRCINAPLSRWQEIVTGLFMLAVSLISILLLAKPLLVMPSAELRFFPGLHVGFDDPDRYRLIESGPRRVITDIRGVTQADVDADRAKVKWGIIGIFASLLVVFLFLAVKGLLKVKTSWSRRERRDKS